MPDRSELHKVTVATQRLALLNAQADEVRAELAALRQDVARMQREVAAAPASHLLEANEQLVIAAMRAQGIADIARRRLEEMKRSAPAAAPPELSPSAERARGEYQMRIQELRKANEKLVIAAMSSRELEADAEETHRKQISFLAMAAHELRNPLLPLRLAAHMLTRPRTEEELHQVQQIIDNQVNHMSRLIGDLLDGSRVSTGKFRLQSADVALKSILEAAIETCQPVMDARHHRFTHASPATLPHMQGDAVRLVQVFSNLLENAAKYTPEGGEISLDAAASADTVVVTVTDNGIGITAEALPHIFELFVQDQHATVHNQGGLGIGLAVVGELVAAHGGSVVAHSRGKDCGSQFVVTLPLMASGPGKPK